MHLSCFAGIIHDLKTWNCREHVLFATTLNLKEIVAGYLGTAAYQTTRHTFLASRHKTRISQVNSGHTCLQLHVTNKKIGEQLNSESWICHVTIISHGEKWQFQQLVSKRIYFGNKWTPYLTPHSHLPLRRCPQWLARFHPLARGWNMLMQFTVFRIHKFSRTFDRPLAYRWEVIMELLVLQTHTCVLVPHPTLTFPTIYPPSFNPMILHACLSREPRHLLNVDLLFCNPTKFYFAQVPTIPHFQHEHTL